MSQLDVQQRRSKFSTYLRDSKIHDALRAMPDSVMTVCPCCGYLTLVEPRSDVCVLCMWEDDGQGDEEADEVWGGPNGRLSLTAGRQNFREHSVSLDADDTWITAERELLPLKVRIIAMFDVILSGVSDERFIQCIVEVNGLARKLAAARTAAYDALQESIVNL